MSLHNRVVSVDKAYAERALSHMAANRPLSRSHVAALASDMLNGYWRLNGEPIVFDTDNNLAEGQHRLRAVLLAAEKRPGFSVQMLEVSGVAVGCRYNMCKARSHANQYAIDGGVNCTKVMALARTVMQWDDKTGLSNHTYASSKPTYDQLAEVLTSDPSIERQIHKNSAASILYSDHVLWFCRWLFARVPGGTEWLSSVIDGSGLASDSPAFVLRNFLIRHRQSKNSVSRVARFANIHVPIAVTIKAWNAHVTHRRIELMKFIASETFPIPHGLRPRD